jgi:L,D-transpeptidase YcbB
MKRDRSDVSAWRRLVLATGVMLCVQGCGPAEREGEARGRAFASARPASLVSEAASAPSGLPAISDIGAALDSLLARETPPSPVSAREWRRVRSMYPRTQDRTRPLWLDARSGRTPWLLEALARAPGDGVGVSAALLDAAASSFAPVGGEGMISARAAAQTDLLLTVVYARYGAVMLSGLTNPRAVGADWHIDTRSFDVDSALAGALHAPDFARALLQLAPQEEGYATLRAALARYRRYVDAGGWPRVRLARTLRPGDSLPPDSHVRQRLIAEAWLDATWRDSASTERDRVYGATLAAAVAEFQRRHGLAPDSIVGPRTRAALNVSADRRLRQIAANMERLRWLPPEFGSRYIMVNIPAYRLDAMEDGRSVLTMRVVVGDELEARQTPIFSDSLQYVQFGPYWNVPASIKRNEILPPALADRGYLERNGYEVVRGWGDKAPVVDPWTLSDAALRSSTYRIRQRPGPNNALGRVKFMFPNDFAVYLHDTPAQALFDERTRAASHGCVRVADPAALAEFVLAARPEWPAARIRETLAAGRRVRVNLRRAIPVYLVYLTVFDRNGQINFRPDPYDRDALLIRALGPVPPADDGADSLHRLRDLLESTMKATLTASSAASASR